MEKIYKNVLSLMLVLLITTGCRKKAFDEYYGRPASLGPPIYQTLQQKGNFTIFLACIDKANYASILKSSGYWTIFAPNDDAFKKYFTINSITSVDQIDAATATKIVTYSLVYSGYTSTPGGVYTGGSIEIAQGTFITGTGTFTPAYKRQTAYYEGIDTTTIPNYPVYGTLAGKNIKVVAQNSSSLPSGSTVYYNSKDLNNKYIPYFTPSYFQANGLSTSDYNFFYPLSNFTNSTINFNVLDGNVVNGNIVCENGVVQEINTVPVPLPSLEKYLKSKPSYSHFYQFIQKYGGLVTYVANADATQTNQVLTGSTATVYVKQYSPLLGVPMQNENVISSAGSNVAQYAGYTLFAPNNAVFDSYVNSVLLEHYTSLDNLPQSVILDFINAHMAQTTIWPSTFSVSQNFNKENPRFNPSADIIDKSVCSNGLFYGTNKVQATNNFSTVYGRPYLDPNYSIMTKVLSYFNLKLNLANPAFKYTMIMVPDVTLRALGYDISSNLVNGANASSGITYLAPGTTGAVQSGTAIDNQLIRIIGLNIYQTPNNELNSLSADAIYATSGLGGIAPEYVRFANNQAFSAGNADGYGGVVTSANPTVVNLNPNFVTTTNGIVYYPTANNNTILINTPVVNSVGTDIFKKGQLTTDPYYMFYKYLSGSSLWNATTKAILGIDAGTDYTIFIPTNAAMQDAVNNGWLPGTGTGAVKVPNYAPTALTDIALVVNFIKYHILKAAQVVPDGQKNGSYNTELFTSDGAVVTLKVTNAKNNMKVTDGIGRVANVLPVSTATLADHATILSIDTYLQFLDYSVVSPSNPNPIKY